MPGLPKYPKVLQLGAVGAEPERLFDGPVVIQEKIDGSQFAFGLDEDGKLCCRSHNSQIDMDEPEQMFREAVEWVKGVEETLRIFSTPGTTFYCEYLKKPKHNTLEYDHIPKNHLALFDVWNPQGWESLDSIQNRAEVLGIDSAAKYSFGETSFPKAMSFLDRESQLGGTLAEGIVIKNHAKLIEVHGTIRPVFAKVVRPQFKEKHKDNPEYKSPKASLEEWAAGLATEARWLKAIQHLREDGKLKGEPSDIGLLVRAVQADVAEEEEDLIKDRLWQIHKKTILGATTKGLPEWYKGKLVTGF